MTRRTDQRLSVAGLGRCDERPATRRSQPGPNVSPVEWVPNRRILRDIPQGFRLAFRCICGEDGLRRFVPEESLPTFLSRASVSGLAILDRVQTLAVEERQTYRLMSFLFRWSCDSRRTLQRRIRRREDFDLCFRERGDGAQQDILPESLEVHGVARQWTPEKLLQAGQRASLKFGEANPTFERQVELGLLEAARATPHQIEDLSAEEIQKLLRFSLFGLNQGRSPRDEQLEERIEGRLTEAVQRHLGQSTADFDKWMFRNFDNLVQQLAKRKSGGEIARQSVRYVLFDLLWRSHRYMSDCVCLQMQAVRLALPKALSPHERQRFGLWYEKQPWLGGLLPIMLHNRMGFVLPTLLDLEESPEDLTPVGIMLRALCLHAELVQNRREADARRKRGNLGFMAEFSDDLHVPANTDHDEDDDGDASDEWPSGWT